MSDSRVAVPCQTAPARWGRKPDMRSIQTSASSRRAASSTGWVSAQKTSMYSRTASSSISLSGSSVRSARPICLTARRLACPYSRPSSTTSAAAVAAISDLRVCKFKLDVGGTEAREGQFRPKKLFQGRLLKYPSCTYIFWEFAAPLWAAWRRWRGKRATK